MRIFFHFKLFIELFSPDGTTCPAIAPGQTTLPLPNFLQALCGRQPPTFVSSSRSSPIGRIQRFTVNHLVPGGSHIRFRPKSIHNIFPSQR